MINRTLHPALLRLRLACKATVSALSDRHSSLNSAQRRKLHILAAAACVPLFGAVAAFGVAPLDPYADLPPSQTISQELAQPVLEQQYEALDQQEQRFLSEERIRRGDTVSALLERLGVADNLADRFIRQDVSARALFQLRPGRVVQAQTDGNGTLLRLRYVHSPFVLDSKTSTQAAQANALEIIREGENFRAGEVALPYERRLEMRSGEIRNSLFAATDSADIPDNIASQIGEVLSGDIDFYRDLRRGDQFRVIYEMFYQAGEAARSGRLLAVEFINSGKPYQAVWFAAPGQSGGYYDFNGQSLRRAFLRTPLEFSRVSSGFGNRRHPIHNVWRAHNGVDYAAPIGTAVRAVGDGIVQFIGNQGGYGNTIVLRHNSTQSTLYAHLSRFSPSVQAGGRVSQGQVIGFVGMTGWATGPHLHYEFRVNNQPQNPLTVVLPQSEPLARQHLATFRNQMTTFGRKIEMLRAFQSGGFADDASGSSRGI